MTLFQTISAIPIIGGAVTSLMFMVKLRYSVKRTAALALISIVPISGFTIWFYLVYGVDFGAKHVLLFFFIPIFVILRQFSFYRDGRFLFSYVFMVTIAVELMFFTNFIDYYMNSESHIIMFILRLFLFPLSAVLILKYLRTPFLHIQSELEKGWLSFSLVPSCLFLLLYIMYVFPKPITERADDMLAMCFLLFCVPLILVQIIFFLFQAFSLFESRERENILSMQAQALKQHLEEEDAKQKRFFIERHDMRHRINAVISMLENAQIREAIEYLGATDQIFLDGTRKVWCENLVLNAVFSFYFTKAEVSHIQLDAVLRIEKKLAIDETDLSIVIANLLENAIHALNGMPEDKRILRCRCTCFPQLLFQISNPCQKDVKFDNNGFPVTEQDGHGLGMRSVRAYCRKHDAECTMRITDGWFVASLVVRSEQIRAGR